MLADQIALYEAEKATGIKLSTKIQPSRQPDKPCTAEPSQVSVSMMRVEGNSASEVIELIQDLKAGRIRVATTISTQNRSAETIEENREKPCQEKIEIK